MTFRNYVGQVIKISVSESLALGAVLAAVILVVGGTRAHIDIALEISAMDGLWILIGLPVLTILALLLVSPLSFGVYRLLTRLGMS